MGNSTTKLLQEALQKNRCAFATTDTERHQLLRLKKQGTFVSPYKGLYAPTDYWNQLSACDQHRHVIRALAIKHDKWIFAALSAVEFWNLEHPYHQRFHERFVTIRSTWSSVSRNGTHRYDRTHPPKNPRSVQPLRRIYIKNDDFVTIDDVRVTSLYRTVVDSILITTLHVGLPIADSILRQGITFDDIAEYCATLPQQCDRVLRTFQFADKRAENGGESLMRSVIIERGFAIPELQVEFPDTRPGRSVVRVDALWQFDGDKVVLEFDGLKKYTEPSMMKRRRLEEVITEQSERDRVLTEQGVSKVIHCYYEDIADPERLVKKLVEAGIPRQCEQRVV